MADAQLLEDAGRCYERAGQPWDAARCYRESGAYRRSADLFLKLREFREAAEDFAQAGQVEQAAWILVRHCADPAAARALLAAAPVRDHAPTSSGGEGDPSQLRRMVVLARCALAERAPEQEVLAVLSEICDDLARPRRLHDILLENWCVELAETMGRDDQIALIFAAAVRGRRSGARERWGQWSESALSTPLILPQDEISAGE